MSADVAEFPAIDGVDSARGMRSIGANPAVYRRLLRLFCDQHSDDGARLLSLLDAGRRADAARMVHRLRGSALILGLVGVAHQAARIEGHLSVGADALALWQQGRLQEAMSLLYRGALSRLVHGHGVPIRASSTEGDCLRLARPHLAEGPARYFALLVDAWRATVYAARPPADGTMQLLCAEFDRRLPAPTEATP